MTQTTTIKGNELLLKAKTIMSIMSTLFYVCPQHMQPGYLADIISGLDHWKFTKNNSMLYTELWGITYSHLKRSGNHNVVGYPENNKVCWWN